MVTPRVAALLGLSMAGTAWRGAEPPEEGDGWEISPATSGGSPIEIGLQLQANASAQVFVATRAWVRAGVGFGLASYDPDDDPNNDNSSETVGPGVLASAGYEILHTETARRNRGLSLELQFIGGPLGTEAYAYGVCAGLGFQVY
jgi:hypothetical protein